MRLWDTFDGYWMDVSRPVTKEEADKILAEKTENGTNYTKYEDMTYYAIFPANTTMLWSPGRSYLGMDEDGRPEEWD